MRDFVVSFQAPTATFRQRRRATEGQLRVARVVAIRCPKGFQGCRARVLMHGAAQEMGCARN